MTDEFDFGFTAVDGDSLFKPQKEQETEVIRLQRELHDARQKLIEVSALITPLLNNLEKDSDKAYIHWPNRQQSITMFKRKLNKLLE